MVLIRHISPPGDGRIPQKRSKSVDGRQICNLLIPVDRFEVIMRTKRRGVSGYIVLKIEKLLHHRSVCVFAHPCVPGA
jgi:hypothetical protein